MTSQVSISVGSSKNGSMFAVFGSGISSMSDASMPFQPAIDEPSKAWPALNLSSSKAETGTVTCCSLPRVSVKRKSTNLTSASFTRFITSATVFAINISPDLGFLRWGGSDLGGSAARASPKTAHQNLAESMPVTGGASRRGGAPYAPLSGRFRTLIAPIRGRAGRPAPASRRASRR
jgi:hypothetical protein